MNNKIDQPTVSDKVIHLNLKKQPSPCKAQSKEVEAKKIWMLYFPKTETNSK